MPNYREMYYKLYRAHCKVLAMLNAATLETEQMAMDAKDPVALPDGSGNGAKAADHTDGSKNSVIKQC